MHVIRGGHKVINTKLFSQEDIKQVITMEEVIEITDKTFQDMGLGKTINPTKLGLDLGESAPYPNYKGFMNAMPAYVGWLDSAGIKWAGGFLGKRKELGLPYITSLILLIDPQIGNFKAVMDGEYITSLRTGAQTAVALKYILNKKEINLGLYGAGMQGHTQTLAISKVFTINNIIVYDINRKASEKFAEDMKSLVNGEIIIANNPEEVTNVNAVVCVTQSKDKFLKNNWIKPGTVVFPMGSYQECEDEFILTADRIIVDHIGQALHRGALKELSEKGKIIENSIYATISEIAVGKKEGYMKDNERILCIPIGTGMLDIAVATVAMQKGIEKGLGSSFAFV